MIGRSIHNYLCEEGVTSIKFISYSEFWENQFSDSITEESTVFWTFGGRNHIRLNLPSEVEAIQRFLNLKRVKENRPKIVYLSSGEVYGNSPTPFNIVDPPDPVSEYGVTKLSIESFLKEFSKEYSILVQIYRLANVYGHSNLASQQNLISKLLQAGRKTSSRVKITVNTESRKQYGSVSDYAREICLHAFFPGLKNPRFEIHNIAPDFSYSVGEIIHCVSRILKVNPHELVVNLDEAMMLPLDNRLIAPHSIAAFEWSRIEQSFLNLNDVAF